MGRDPLGVDIKLGVAPGAQHARSTNYVAKGAVGQGDHDGEGQRVTNVVARETIEVRRGLGVPQVKPP